MKFAAVLSRLPGALRRFDRILTYVVVGGAIALVQVTLTAALVMWSGVRDPSIASVVASGITIPISFLAHKRTTYADVARQPFQGVRFAATACSSVVIAAGTIKLTQMLGAPIWFSVLLGSALVPVGNYAINGLWVFRTKAFFSIDESSR